MSEATDAAGYSSRYQRSSAALGHFVDYSQVAILVPWYEPVDSGRSVNFVDPSTLECNGIWREKEPYTDVSEATDAAGYSSRYQRSFFFFFITVCSRGIGGYGHGYNSLLKLAVEARKVNWLTYYSRASDP